jgi:hypothetical protein
MHACVAATYGVLDLHGCARPLQQLDRSRISRALLFLARRQSKPAGRPPVQGPSLSTQLTAGLPPPVTRRSPSVRQVAHARTGRVQQQSRRRRARLHAGSCCSRSWWGCMHGQNHCSLTCPTNGLFPPSALVSSLIEPYMHYLQWNDTVLHGCPITLLV